MRPPLRTEPRPEPEPAKGFVLAGFVRTLRKQAKRNLAGQAPLPEPAPQPEPAPRAAKWPILRTTLLLAFVAISVPQMFPADATVAPHDFSQSAASLTSISEDLFNAPAAVTPALDAGLQIVQQNFDPVLVERLESIGLPLSGLTEPGASPAAPIISNEMLRVIAKMTPEQIDALTLLLLAQQGAAPAAAPDAAQTASVPDTDTAIWVGDWQDFDETSDALPPATVLSPESEFLQGWRIVEASPGMALIQNNDDPLSGLTVVPGTVLGSLGSVDEIRLEEGSAVVMLSSGEQISSDIDTILPMPQPKLEAPLAASLDQTPVPEGETGTTADLPPEGEADPQVVQPEPALPATDDAGLSDGVFIQVGTFKSSANADTALKMLGDQKLLGKVLKASQGNSDWHRVVAGPIAEQDLTATLSRLGGIGFKDAFVLR